MGSRAKSTKSTYKPTSKRSTGRPSSHMYGVIPMTKAGSKKRTRK